MSYKVMLGGTVAAAALVASGAAQADLAAGAVWQTWKDHAAASEQTITAGSETDEGGTLTVRDIRVTAEEDGLSMEGVIGEIVLAEQPDGSVAITMSDSYQVRMSGTEGQVVVLEARQPGMQVVAREMADGVGYEVQAPEMSLAVVEVTGEDVPEVLDVTLTALGVRGSYTMADDPNGPTTAELASGAVNLAMNVVDEEGRLDASYAVSGGRMTMEGAGLALVQDDPAAALREGFAFDLGLGYDTLRYEFDFADAESASQASGGASDGQSRFVMSAEEFAISSSSRNGEITVAGDDMPLPSVALKASELAFGLRMPTMAAQEAQDFSIETRIVEASVGEGVWNMMDPTGSVERSPATVILDLTGRVRVLTDLFSQEAAMGMMIDGPEKTVQIEEARLNELVLRAAGAELTGEGAFTFDNSDYETIPGMPRPTGTLDLALRGGNKVLDTLVEMGLVPQEQAMGLRMMFALFARPGEGEDELLSTLEVREDGAVLANGQRIQ